MNYFAAELKEEWALMRQGRFTLDNLLKYVVQNQIEVIPAKYYNDDAQIKYLDFGSLYTYCCHGSKELLVKRWLRERIAYVDSMMGYFTSQDDQVTIRMNKTGYVEFSVTPYIPLYFSVKWSNADGGTQTFKLKRGETKTFYYTSTTATDQEVIIYHAQYIKELEGISNLRPSSCILANATKLNNVEIHSDKLYNVNVSNNKYLRKLDLSGCSTLGTVTATGSVLDVSKCKYLSYLNIYDTALTGVLLNTSGGSLKEIYYPKSIQEVQLIKQTLLEVVGLPYGNSGAEIPTSLYTVDIQECPSIKKLNTSNNSAISKTWISMKYCQNLTIRNALDFEEISLDGFQRLKVLKLENMFKLKSLGFDDMLEVGGTSTLQYMGISYCPALTDITMNCSSNDYEITFANGALLNLTGATNLNSLSSNCVIHGLETIVLPLSVEHLYFTSEYGTGFSSIKNIWSSRCCEINTEGVLPVAIRYEDKDFVGIDLQGMKMKDIDLGALVNVPAAINFDLSPTTVNPNFNINRDGINYSYLQPVGTLDLSNYTGSLAKFFNGVDLDVLEIIVNNDLTQKDLSYCFYNAFFSDPRCVLPITERLNGVINLDYCFYSTIVSDISIINHIRLGDNCSMRYTFAKCPNITIVKNVNIPATTTSCEGMLSENNNLVSVSGLVVNSQNASGLLKNCSKLTSLEATVNSKIVDSLVEGCSKLTTLEKLTLGNPGSIKALIKNCALLTLLDLSKSNLSNCNAMDNLCYGATSLTELKMTGTVGSSTCTYSNFINGAKAGLIINLANSIITSPNFINSAIFNGCNDFTLDLRNSDLSAFTDFTEWLMGTGIKKLIVDDVIWASKNIVFDRMMKNCTNLVEDIIFPVSVISAIECFKKCIKIVAINSNWNTKYTRDIVPTDCYTGCTGIQTVNGVQVTNEYSTGLDEVPTAWGGYGFTKECTGIYKVVIPSDNYTYTLGFASGGTCCAGVISQCQVNWGDGTSSGSSDWSDGSIPSHTYAKAGTYIIKGKIHPCNGMRSVMGSPLIEVLQVPHELKDIDGYLDGTYNPNLQKADLSNMNEKKRYCNSMFYNCRYLTEIILPKGFQPYRTQKMFKFCSSLTTIPWFDTSKNEYFGGNGSGIINNCTSLISAPEWDFSSAKGITRMLGNTKNLESFTFTNLPDNTSWNDGYGNGGLFGGESSGIIELRGVNFTGMTLNYINTSGIFHEATNLQTITYKEGSVIDYEGTLYLQNPKLTKETLLNTISILKDFSGTSITSTLSIGATNLAKLTDEDIAIATNKGWSVV